MKKILLGFAVILVLTGAGCARQENNKNEINFGNGKISDIKENNGKYAILRTSFGNAFVNQDKLTIEESVEKASVDAGFKIYYPTYSPSGFVLQKTLAWTKDDASLSLISVFSGPSSPMILIVEIPLNTKADNLLSRQEKKISSKEAILVNGQEGFFGTFGSDNAFNMAVFTTKDGTKIGIWSRAVSKDEIIKIANSMRAI